MARDEFFIELLTKFKPDEISLRNIKKSFDTFNKIEIFSDKDEKLVSELKETFNTFEARKSMLADLTSSLAEYRSAKGMSKKDEDDVTKSIRKLISETIGDNPELKKLFGEQAKKYNEVLIGNLQTRFFVKLEEASKSFLNSLENVFTDAWNEYKEMQQASLMTNQTTRENMFAYGFTPGQSYGFEQAKSMLGIQGEEDLWYMNQTQREQFQRIMTKYAEKYTSLADSGFFDTMLNYQIEMQEMKQDLQMTIVEFIVNNKDLIISFMTMSMSFLKGIMEIVSWIADLFSVNRSSDAERAANIDSILNSYTQNKNMQFNQTNNFNNVSGQFVDSSLNQLTAQTTEALRAFGE